MTLREWQSPEGRRWVESTLPDGRLLVRTERLAFAQILPPSELDREIHRDESNAKSRHVAHESIERERVAGDIALTEKRGLYGFTEGMPMVKARKIETALDKIQMFNGELMKRRTFIENAVAAGASIGSWHGNRTLEFLSGSFMSERDVTKTGLDYAIYLINLGLTSLGSPRR